MPGRAPRRRGPSSEYAWASPTQVTLHWAGLEARRILHLVEPVEPHLLDDAVAHHDEARVAGRGEMLVRGERRNVDVVAALPLELLRHIGPFPFEGIEAVEFHVPVQVVALALDHEDELLPHVPMLDRALARLET